MRNTKPPPPVPVSVVIPALNAEAFIADALASVQAQTVAVAETIVVDNGCTDRTVEIAGRMGAIIVERRDKQGISSARNAGIKASGNPWIAFLDADDRWQPSKLERQWSAIQAWSDVGIVSCYVLISENDSIVVSDSVALRQAGWQDYQGKMNVRDNVRYFPELTRDFFPRFMPMPSDVMIRRDVFGTVGLFDEDLLYCEDLELFLRAMARYPLAIVEQVLVNNRRHAGKHSLHLENMRSNLFAVVNRMLSHRQQYPAGAPEAYRDLLKQNFLLAEKSLNDESETRRRKGLAGRNARK